MSFYGLKMWRKTLKIGVFRGVLAVGNDICRLSVKRRVRSPFLTVLGLSDANLRRFFRLLSADYGFYQV